MDVDEGDCDSLFTAKYAVVFVVDVASFLIGFCCKMVSTDGNLVV